MSVVDIIVEYRVAFASGLFVTLQLCLIIWTAGLFFGTILGVAAHYYPTGLGAFSRVGSFVLSGLPVLVFLFWLHYPLQALLDVVIPPFTTAAAALSVLNILIISELVRGVLRDFPSQYVVAARVCGMTPGQTFRYIQFPIIFRQLLPGLLTSQVYMLQATLFASLISVEEVFRVAQRINAQVYKPVEIYTALGLFFLAICLPLNGLALWMRKRYTRDLSER
jgi:His/Glu/Gln/Arg/opine family amino acid ABC transporter permease subunit